MSSHATACFLDGVMAATGCTYGKGNVEKTNQGKNAITLVDLRARNVVRLVMNQELKRRSRVIRIFPNEASCLRVLGTLCMEQSEIWETGKIYITMPSTEEGMTTEFAKAV